MLYTEEFTQSLNEIKGKYSSYLSYTSLADNPIIPTTYDDHPLPDTAAASATPGECTAPLEWISLTASAPRVTLEEYPACLQEGDIIMLGKLAWIGRVLRALGAAAATDANSTPADRAVWRRAAQRIHAEIRQFATDIVWLIPADPRSPLNEDTGAEVVRLIADLLVASRDLYEICGASQ